MEPIFTTVCHLRQLMRTFLNPMSLRIEGLLPIPPIAFMAFFSWTTVSYFSLQVSLLFSNSSRAVLFCHNSENVSVVSPYLSSAFIKQTSSTTLQTCTLLTNTGIYEDTPSEWNALNREAFPLPGNSRTPDNVITHTCDWSSCLTVTISSKCQS